MTAATDTTSRAVILVVDDEAGVRQLSRRILEQGGYAVLEAADGLQALATIESGQPVDFLVVDLDMPVMRGEQLSARIRTAHPDLRVLYVTAHSEALFVNRPELTTGEAFLDKPYTVRGLLEAVSLLKNGYISRPQPNSSVMEQMWRTVLATVRKS
jgi:CheY-like chemotaxis protein